jgi:hypothetical protein
MFNYFFLISLLAQTAHQQAPSNIQVDVVFPREGGRYAPVYPFPIVMAVHNLSHAWRYDLQLFYRIRDLKGNDGDFGFSEVMWPRDNEKDGLKTGPNTETAPPPDKFLFINGTDKFARVATGEFSMIVGLRMAVNCTEGPVTAEEKDEALRHTPGTGLVGGVTFSMAADGELPNVMAGGECADPLIAMEVNGTILYDDAPVRMDDPEWYGKQCPILTDPYPDPKSGCQYRLTSDDQKKVEDEMLEVAGCAGRKGVSWPSRDLVLPCDKSSGSHARPLSWLLTVATIACTRMVLV